MISRFNEPLENWLVDHMATKWLWHDRFLNIHLGLKSKLKSLLLESNLNIDKVTVHFLGLGIVFWANKHESCHLVVVIYLSRFFWCLLFFFSLNSIEINGIIIIIIIISNSRQMNWLHFFHSIKRKKECLIIQIILTVSESQTKYFAVCTHQYSVR